MTDTTDASTRVCCPRCRSRTLELTEVGEWSISWQVREGRLSRKEGYQEPGGMLYVYARCARCSHHWKVRGALQITDVIIEDIDNPTIQTRS